MMVSKKSFKALLNQHANDYRSKNPDKLSASSKYFGQIGSIPLEDIPYKEQLAIKLQTLKDTLSEIADEDFISNYKIEGSSEIYEYRFRMDYVCAFDPIH